MFQYINIAFITMQTIILVPCPSLQDISRFLPDFDTSTVNMTVIQGHTAFLNCTVLYADGYKVAWLNPENKVLTNNEKRIIDDIRITMERPTLKDWNLHIRNIGFFDEGVYSCSINTEPVLTKKVYLKVLVPARILEQGSSRDITAIEGTKVVLTCNVTGIPPPTVQWFRHISKTDYNHATKEVVEEPGEVLIIHNITRYCGGTYECVAFNRVDKADSRLIKVDVIFRPEIELPTKRISQYLYKETILQCIIRANPLLSAEWQRNGIPVQNTRHGKYRVEMYNHYSEVYTDFLDLSIHSVEIGDYGNYTCVAINSLGEDSETMSLFEATPATKPPTTPRHKATTKASNHLLPYGIHNQHKRPITVETKIRNQNTGSYRPRNTGTNLRDRRLCVYCYVLLMLLYVHHVS